MAGGQVGGDLFEAYFRRADLDRDGKISGAEAVAFFQGSGLSKPVLAQIWNYADQNKASFLGRAEFFNALKLVTVAQSNRDLTPEIVRSALYGPASAQIPPPKINLANVPGAQPGGPGVAGPPVAQPGAPAGGGVGMPNQGGMFRGPSVSPNVNMNQQFNQAPGGGFVRPPQNAAGGVPNRPLQGVGFAGGVSQMGSSPVNTGPLSNAGGANMGGASMGMLPARGSSPLTAQPGLPAATRAPVTSVPSQTPVTSSVMSSGPSTVQHRPPVTQNGFPSGSLFGGDSFSVAPSQTKRVGTMPTTSVGGTPASSVQVPVSAAPQPSSNLRPNSFPPQPAGGQPQPTQSFLKPNQQAPVRGVPPSGQPAVPPHGLAGNQPQPQWPRPTQSDVQKYTKVFYEVDTDKDGKITGEQARNLFLSWRLPREVLKQVWDLSDQDNDSMLSLREFCVALYLMERYREGRPLPATLPSNILLDFPTTPQTTGGFGNAAWGQSPGYRQPHPTPGPGARPSARPPGKPPLPIPAVPVDDRLPPKPQKAKVPVLEKHLVDQLSEEEQKSLNLKFQEATEANKKVEELEKELKESREKMEFYRVKMQELVLYKSRCDNRLNEVSMRAAGDKQEVELLSKKYEEKYKQAGDVASKLTIEEATFRDIQEKKMEMYQAIVKLEQDGSENLQARADRVQSSLEELVKSLSERCKKYGLRAKPSTLLELPFGWQPGIQEGAADWDEDWDKFEDEGFEVVKELTTDVQNVVAPPRTRVKLPKKEKSSDVESKPVKLGEDHVAVAENGDVDSHKEDVFSRSPVASPSAKSSLESPREASGKTFSSDASPRAKESHSDHGVAKASVSEGKSFDEPAWGTFDTSDEVDSIWGASKDMDHKKLNDDLFGYGEFTLPPIKTGSSHGDGFLPKKSIFADSVPGTPADVFLPKKSIFADSVPGTPADGFLPKKSVFADSVPSTPLYNSSYSPKNFGEGSDERGFNFSRFDSFRSTDSGFQPEEKLSHFDSMRSTGDFDAQDGGSSTQRETFSRFDSMRSNKDFDYSQYSSFEDPDPFASGAYKSSFASETPRTDSDAFGGGAQYRNYFGSETPRSEADPFGSVGPFGSSLASETPRGDADPFGSGPFKSSWANETPREADRFGSVGPFGSSLGGETPRRDSDYYGYSGSFKSSFNSETPRGEFDSYGFGGPFGSSMSSETPRRDSDGFGSTGPFRSSGASETPRGGTDNWSAF